MAFKRDTDVLVIGAGPVGLFSALALAERGVTVQVIDKEWHGASHSYALALHPGTLRMLEQYGVAEDLLEHGHRVERVAFYEGDERAGVLDVAALGGRYPFVLVVPQSALERALEQRLKQHRVPVFWNHQCLAMTQVEGEVRARVARMEKYSMGYPIAHTEWMVAKEHDVHARFLVGADGYHSSVRKNLGARYEHKGAAEAFAVYEFPCKIGFPHEVRVVVREGGLNVVWPLHAQRGRWTFAVDAQAPASPTLEALQELIRARAPWFDTSVEELHWTATVVFERRLVDSFGHDRVWLAGDAAHITGPIGAQSMNVGLREAQDLAERFATALKQRGDLAGLASYEAERQAEWKTLLGTDGTALVAADPAPDWARRLGSKIVACAPASGDDLRRLLGQVGLRLQA